MNNLYGGAMSVVDLNGLKLLMKQLIAYWVKKMIVYMVVFWK